MIDNRTNAPMAHYKKIYSELEPAEVSSRTGAEFRNGVFELTMLGQRYQLPWREFESDADPLTQLLMLRYLIGGVSAPHTGRFCAYRELPWGSVYDQNFQGRCVRRLAREFGTDRAAFERAATALGGIAINCGDTAFELDFMPNLKMRLIMWYGDDEFPPSAQILFSDNFCLAFTAEDMAGVGDALISALSCTG